MADQHMGHNFVRKILFQQPVNAQHKEDCSMFDHVSTLCVFTCASLAAWSAQASTFTISFAGTIENVQSRKGNSSTLDSFSNDISTGDAVNGSLVYNPDNAVVGVSGNFLAGYNFASPEQEEKFSVEINQHVWSIDREFGVFVKNDEPFFQIKQDSFITTYSTNNNSLNESNTVFPFSLGIETMEILLIKVTRPNSTPGLLHSLELPSQPGDIMPTALTNNNPPIGDGDDFVATGSLISRSQSDDGFFDINFSIDPSSILVSSVDRSLVNIMEKPTGNQPDATVFLDFENGVNASFNNQTLANGATVVATDETGRTGASNISERLRSVIKEKASAIFRRSGVEVEFVTEKPVSGDFYIAEFGVEDPEVSLLGKAYETGRQVFGADFGTNGNIDRFDQRKDGRVAVLFEPADEIEAGIAAEILAHELGHGFGLRHIEADFPIGVSPGSNEVMDYTLESSDLAKFFDQDISIYEFSAKTFKPITHNPQYHLRRFAGNEKKGDLLEERLDAGTWDSRAFELFGFEFGPGLSSFDGAIDWFLALEGDSGFFEGGDEPKFSLTSLGSGVEGEVFNISISEDQGFSFFGRSAGSDILDIFTSLSSTDPTFGVYAPAELGNNRALSIFQQSELGAAIERIGTANLRTVGTALVSPAATVPLPSPLFLISSAIFILFRKKISGEFTKYIYSNKY